MRLERQVMPVIIVVVSTQRRTYVFSSPAGVNGGLNAGVANYYNYKKQDGTVLKDIAWYVISPNPRPNHTPRVFSHLITDAYMLPLVDGG